MRDLIFIGIDPGTRFMGYGVIDGEGNYIDSGVIAANQRSPLFVRLDSIGEALADVLSRYSSHSIGAIGIEEPFLRAGVAKSALTLTGAFWKAVFTARTLGLSVYTAKPQQLKQLSGAGNNDKAAVMYAAQVHFGLTKPFQHNDEADALWMALWAHWNFTTQAVPRT